MDTYLQYFKSLHSLAAFVVVIVLFAVTQVFHVCSLKILLTISSSHFLKERQAGSIYKVTFL